MKLVKNNSYLLLIDEEAEIKDGDICIDSTGVIFKHENHFPISIGQRKITAYYPLTKEAKELDLPELPPFEDGVNIGELAENIRKDKYHDNSVEYPDYNIGFEDGYKAAQSKQFSLEDMKKAFEEGSKHKYVCEANGKDKKCYCRNDNECNFRYYMTAEEFIQSLSTQQTYPKEFIPEYEDYEIVGERDGDGYPLWSKRLKTITNSESKEEIQGTYKY